MPTFVWLKNGFPLKRRVRDSGEIPAHVLVIDKLAKVRFTYALFQL